jgi:uncharacterized protein with NRDE domain
MCLIVLSYKTHPIYKLIFAANRDEFYERPTRPADFWEEHKGLLAGKDLKEGGTWLGITTKGKFAAITNYRDFNNIKKNASSRGHIVTDYLTQNIPVEKFAQKLILTSDEYNGYNFFFGGIDSLSYFSNETNKLEEISPGIHGLSNHLLNTPWPKVERSKRIFNEIIKENNLNIENIFTLLMDRFAPPDEELPDTGVGIEIERLSSTIFISSAVYGTRSSTIVLIDKNDEAIFIERTYEPGTTSWNERHFNFKIEKERE